MFAEFHPQCTASAAVLSKKKVSERDDEPRDPTAAVKDWVKSVGVLKAGWYDTLVLVVFLLHLLIAGCYIGVQISVRPFSRSFVRPFVNIYVEVWFSRHQR